MTKFYCLVAALAVFAPAAAGLVAGNVTWQGLSLLTTGQLAATMADTAQPVNAAAALAAMAAAGITGYMLGKKHPAPKIDAAM